jgi:hypothetical protein
MMVINGDTTVRELLMQHPEVFDVLADHGMCADCKIDPPPVPLHHFAGKHCSGDVEGLIVELRQAMTARH